MTEEQIKHMVSRFLQWRLPDDFCPDAGISFKRDFNEHTPHPMKHEPVGTNLFSALQAEAMVRHMLADTPPPEPESDEAMVEKVARAMLKQSRPSANPDAPTPFPRGRVGFMPTWMLYGDIAAAAIAAMKEPT